MEETRWEGQNFSEVVAPQEEKDDGGAVCRPKHVEPHINRE